MVIYCYWQLSADAIISCYDVNVHVEVNVIADVNVTIRV